MMFTVAKLPARSVRLALYRAAGMNVGPDVVIHKGLEARSLRSIVIGRGTIVGFDCILDGRGGITIGDHVNFSSEAAVWTEQHDLRDPDFETVKAPVIIGDRAWLSFRCVVLPGVTIGTGAVIAAGAVVTKDVPAFAVMAGVPATQVGERPREIDYVFDASNTPWFI
jgi:acetyltransferase-like isoleucine patch superfamily enzyme